MNAGTHDVVFTPDAVNIILNEKTGLKSELIQNAAESSAPVSYLRTTADNSLIPQKNVNSFRHETPLSIRSHREHPGYPQKGLRGVMIVLNKKVVIGMIIAALAAFLAYYLLRYSGIGVAVPAGAGADPVTGAEPRAVKVVGAPAAAMTAGNRHVKFKTNREIRDRYGRLEIVTLRNGMTYEGAVISTGGLYTMVTVNGVVSIPMSQVKMRDIIK